DWIAELKAVLMMTKPILPTWMQPVTRALSANNRLPL
ncbi:hypothetical protein PSYMO_37731, partial [Pseudomonas amygdali pv. mori str. 301020]